MTEPKRNFLRIALITDLHTGSPTDAPFNVDLRKNFLSVLRGLQSHDPDCLIIGGDLCLLDGDLEIYQWQKQHIDSLDLPYYLIAGNHDEPTLLAKVFDHLPRLTERELYYQILIGRFRFLFLDTSHGRLSGQQKEWLKENLAKSIEFRAIFMHHPPDVMHIPYMDSKYSLQDRDEVMHILKSADKQIEIFCGHYHVEKTVSLDQINVHITPSCYFQVDGDTDEFRIDHQNIAYRIIDFHQDRIEHEIHYLPGNLISDSG